MLPPFKFVWIIARYSTTLCIGEDIDLAEQSNGLQQLDENDYETLTVDRDCELKNLLTRLKPNKKGCVYYEFVRREEDISEVDKKVILKDKV